MHHHVFPRSFHLAAARHGCSVAESDLPIGLLATGIVELAEDRLRDGLEPASVRGMILYPGRAVLDLCPPGTRTEEIDLDFVRDLVLRAKAAGYSPTTIRGKHLPVIRSVLVAAGLHDCTTEAKRRMRAALAGRYAPPPRLDYEDLERIFRGIEEFPKHLKTRREDLALIRLLALRAVRTAELCRVLIERDCHLYVPCIDIAEAKDRSNPRRIELSVELAQDVQALMGGRQEGPLVTGGPRRINARLEAWKHRLKEPRLNQRHLRRSCATNLHLQGAPLPVVRAVLGHAHNSAQTTRYLLDDPDRVRAELRRLEHRSHPHRRLGS